MSASRGNGADDHAQIHQQIQESQEAMMSLLGSQQKILEGVLDLIESMKQSETSEWLETLCWRVDKLQDRLDEIEGGEKKTPIDTAPTCETTCEDTEKKSKGTPRVRLNSDNGIYNDRIWR